MGVRTTHAWRLGGFNPACHSGWLLYDNTKGLSIGGVCFFAIALQEHWNRLIARVFSNGADTSSPQKQTNKPHARKFIDVQFLDNEAEFLIILHCTTGTLEQAYHKSIQ